MKSNLVRNNFGVSNTIFSPKTLYPELNTNNSILQNGATQKKITLDTNPNLNTNYEIDFPATAPSSNQLLLFNGTDFIWSSAGSLANAIKNIVIVQQNPSAGQFSNIASAMASITNASSTNPYLIYVGPGVYVENNPITILPFVAVQGCAPQQVIVQASNLTQPIFMGNPSASLITLTLSGSPLSAVAYNGSSLSTAGFNLYMVQFLVNTVCLNFTSSSGANRSLIQNCVVAGISNPVSGFSFTSSGTQLVSLIQGLLWNPSINTNITSFISASGSSSFIVISDLVVGSLVLTPKGNAVNVSNGATVSLQNSSILGFANGFYNPNTGAGSPIVISDTTFKSNTLDINILNTLSSGSVIASATKENIVISPSTVSAVITGMNGNIVGTGQLYIGANYSQITNYSTQIEQGSNLGVISGGALSFSGLNVTAQSGIGYLMIGTHPTDYLWYTVWNTQTIPVPANTLAYLYIDNTGTLQYSTSAPSLFTTIRIGLVYTSGTSILIQENVPQNAVHTASDLDLNLADVMGPLFGSGCMTTQNATLLHLNVSSGTYILSTNTYNPSSGTDITWTSFYQNGSGGWNFITGNQAITGQWDNGSGTLQTLSAGVYTKDVLYVVGDGVSQQYLLVFGQTTFATETDAINGSVPLAPYFFSGGNIVPITGIVVEGGTPTITDLLDLRPRLGFVSPTVLPTGTVSQVNTGAGLTGGPITTIGTISVPNGGITNAMLVNDSITITAGTGLTGGGNVVLGGTTTISSTTTTPSYVVMTADAVLPNERTLNVNSGQLTLTDNGAGLTAVLGLPNVGTSGTYTYPASITTDTQGRVSAITSGAKTPAPNDASYLLISADALLPNERTLTTTSSDITFTDNGAGLTANLSLPNVGTAGVYNNPSAITTDARGRVSAISTLGYTPAPDNASYILITNDLTLTNDRALTTTATDLVITDGGANSTVNLSLANTAVVAGSYTAPNITVDSRGRLTSATSNTLAPINASYILVSNDPTLLDDRALAVNTGDLSLTDAGPNLSITLALTNVGTAGVYNNPSSITTDARGRVSAISTLGYTPAPISASYILISNDPTLTNDRALTTTATDLVITDGGANSTVNLSLANTTVIAGSYTAPNITVDSRGRITTASSNTLAPTNASYVLIANDPTLTADRALAVSIGDLTLTDNGANSNVVLGLPNVGTAGTFNNPSAITTDARGRVSAISTLGYTPAPVGASYVLISNDPTLTADRALAVTAGDLTLTDNGANSNVVLGLPNVGTAGTYTQPFSITTDARGRVSSVSVSNVEATDSIPTPIPFATGTGNASTATTLEGGVMRINTPTTFSHLVFRTTGGTNAGSAISFGVYQSTGATSGTYNLICSGNVATPTNNTNFQISFGSTFRLNAGLAIIMYFNNGSGTPTISSYTLGTINLLNSNMFAGTYPVSFTTALVAFPATFNPTTTGTATTSNAVPVIRLLA